MAMSVAVSGRSKGVGLVVHARPSGHAIGVHGRGHTGLRAHLAGHLHGHGEAHLAHVAGVHVVRVVAAGSIKTGREMRVGKVTE